MLSVCEGLFCRTLGMNVLNMLGRKHLHANICEITFPVYRSDWPSLVNRCRTLFAYQDVLMTIIICYNSLCHISSFRLPVNSSTVKSLPFLEKLNFALSLGIWCRTFFLNRNCALRDWFFHWISCKKTAYYRPLLHLAINQDEYCRLCILLAVLAFPFVQLPFLRICSCTAILLRSSISFNLFYNCGAFFPTYFEAFFINSCFSFSFLEFNQSIVLLFNTWCKLLQLVYSYWGLFATDDLAVQRHYQYNMMEHS